MMKRFAIFGAFVIAVAAMTASVVVSARQDFDERRAKFFGSSKEFPTTGGEKMKVDW